MARALGFGALRAFRVSGCRVFELSVFGGFGVQGFRGTCFQSKDRHYTTSKHSWLSRSSVPSSYRVRSQHSKRSQRCSHCNKSSKAATCNSCKKIMVNSKNGKSSKSNERNQGNQ